MTDESNAAQDLRGALGDHTAIEKIAMLSNEDWPLARLDMAATLDMIHEIAVSEIYPAALAQPAENAKAGEVVAYLYSHPTDSDSDPLGTLPLTEADKAAGWTETPLYAHHPAAEPVGLREAIDRVEARFHPHYGIDGASDSKQLAADCRLIIAAATPARTDDAGRPGGDVAAMIGTGKGVILDAVLDEIIDNPRPADDDEAFTTVWLQLESRGYLWSEDNVEKVHLGWLLARALPLPAAEEKAGVGEVGRLMHVIDRDRYAAAACVNAIEFVLHTRSWLREAGRGSYAYDDDRYQEEFGLAFDEIVKALEPMRALSRDKTDCTTDEEKVRAARVAGAEKFASLSRADLDEGEGK